MTDRYISMNETRQIAGGKSRVTLWRWVKAGLFPKPRKIGPNSIAWLESELIEWVESRKEV